MHVAFSSLTRFSRTAGAVLLALGTTIGTARAQSGVATFAGQTNVNGAVPVATYTGPALTFTTQVRSGFGNSASVGGADGRWWTDNYSGQGMLYGNNSGRGNVLEVTFDAGSGFNLFLTGALFGGWSNRSANITFQLFNADYSQSTSLVTVLAGATTPANANFATNGWGNIIRLQFMETTASGEAAGRGAFDVGVQDVRYSVERANAGPGPDPNVVPEPSTYALLGTGLVAMAGVARRRRAA